jgi:hypothetical protein
MLAPVASETHGHQDTIPRVSRDTKIARARIILGRRTEGLKPQNSSAASDDFQLTQLTGVNDPHAGARASGLDELKGKPA